MATIGAPRYQRNSLEKEKYKNQIVSLYLQRKSQGEIAKLMGISQPAVSQWIRKITEEWRNARFKNLDALKFEELERINRMESEMWEMWERSKANATKKSTLKETVGVIEIKTPGSDTKSVPKAWRVQDKEQPQEGNMEYWHAIQWCVDRRVKMLGLDAPQKIAQTDPSGENEYGAGAKELLISKIMDMVNNRDEAARRKLDQPEVEWTPKRLTTTVIDVEEVSPDEFEINRQDDPVTKAIKRRALEEIEAKKEAEEDE